MDPVSELHFDCLCRTCMHEFAFAATVGQAAEQPEIEWKSIFDIIADCGSMRIIELLSNTTPHLEVSLSDELPEKICRECLEQLVSVYRFQQMCIQSDQQMRELLIKKYPDVKLITPAPLTGVEVKAKEFSILETITDTNDPLQSIGKTRKNCKDDSPSAISECLKMEISDEDVYSDHYSTHETMLELESVTEDLRMKIETGTPTVVQDKSTMSIKRSSQEDLDGYGTSDKSNLRARKPRNLKKVDVKTKVKVKKSRKSRSEQAKEA